MDASTSGWGALFECRPFFGQWSEQEKLLHINNLVDDNDGSRQRAEAFLSPGKKISASFSDLQALSVSATCMEFGPNDSKVILKPRQGCVPISLNTPFRAQVISLSALPVYNEEKDVKKKNAPSQGIKSLCVSLIHFQIDWADFHYLFLFLIILYSTPDNLPQHSSIGKHWCRHLQYLDINTWEIKSFDIAYQRSFVPLKHPASLKCPPHKQSM